MFVLYIQYLFIEMPLKFLAKSCVHLRKTWFTFVVLYQILIFNGEVFRFAFFTSKIYEFTTLILCFSNSTTTHLDRMRISLWDSRSLGETCQLSKAIIENWALQMLKAIFGHSSIHMYRSILQLPTTLFRNKRFILDEIV